jgi:mRNA interferase RelE/StbE
VDEYSLSIKPSAVKELDRIPLKKDRQRIVAAIQKLAGEPRPHGCEKLAAREGYRVRQGRYRVIYVIDDEARTVVVVKVGHRKDVYR